MDEQLKPCPFCGSAMEIYEDVVDASPSWYTANCTKNTCRCVSWGGTNYDAVIARANTRPIEDALRAELDELRRKWAGVPMDAIADMFAYTWGEDDRDDVPDFVTTIEAWMDATFPATN